MSQERCIPVAAAKRFAEQHGKSIAVLLGYDRADNQVYVATYGVAPPDKQIAATWGEQCAKAIGCGDMGNQYADFRTTDQAQWAREREQLCDVIHALVEVAADAEAALRPLSKKDGPRDGVCSRLKAAIAAGVQASATYHQTGVT